MNSKFATLKKQTALFIFSCFLSMSTYIAYGHNSSIPSLEQIEKDPSEYDLKQNLSIEKKEQTSYLTTTQRTILKSIIETFWDKLKETYKSELKKESNGYQVEPFKNYGPYEIGKVFSHMIADEFVPNPNSSIKQKLVELWTPVIVSFVIVHIISSNIPEKDYKKLSTSLISKLINKLIFVRLFQKPGTKEFTAANILAILGCFYNSKTNSIDYITGMEKLALDQLRFFIQSSDLGTTLNEKQRKKAIGKSSQVLGKPLVQYLLKIILNNLNLEKA